MNKEDIRNKLNNLQVIESPGYTAGQSYGGWDWGKKSRAVIASRNGDGAVLWWVGGHLDFEICESGLSSLDDLGLDNAPDGVHVWEGVYHYTESYGEYGGPGDGCEAEPDGEFRKPTEEEWVAIREARCPWDENDWLEAMPEC